MSENKIRKQFPEWWDVLVIVWIFVFVMGLGSVFIKNIGLTLKLGDDATTSLSYLFSFVLAIFSFRIYRNLRGGKPTPLRTIAREKATPQLILGSFILLVCIGVALEPAITLLPQDYFVKIDNIINNSYGAIISIIAAPILEEYFFRGLLQKSLTVRYKALSSILTASVIFGLIHFNPAQIGGAFFAGFVIGYVYNQTQSIGAAIFIHALNNASSFIMAVLLGSSSITLKTILGNEYSIVYWIIYSICVIICIVSFSCMIAKLRKK